MKQLNLLPLVFVLASPAFAFDNTVGTETFTLRTAPVQLEIGMTCAFETECFESESCAETTFSGELKGKAGGLTDVDMVVELDLITEIGDTTLLGARSGKAMSLAGGTFEARHLLTIAEDGTARYTLHYADGPMAISYFGACE